MTPLVTRAALGAALVLCLAPAAAPAADKAPTNAALIYWQAFALVPQLDKKQQQTIAEHDKVKLGEDVDKLLASCDTSLRLLHRAAGHRACDWGVTPGEDGINTLMPHLDRGFRLARVALLRARKRFEGADPRGGLADALAAMTLGRHLGTDKLPLSFLVQCAIDRRVIDLGARHLPSLGADDRKALVKRLEGLPAGATLKDALEMEKRPTSTWFLGRLEGLRKDKMWKGKVLELLAPPTYPEPEKRRKQVQKMLDGLGDDGLEKLIGHTKEIGRTLDAIIKLADRTPEQAAKALKPLLTGEAVKKNPLSDFLLPGANYAVVWERDAEAKVRLALLKAAVAVQGGKVDDLKSHPDPYGKGPFAHKKVPGGFELSSALKVKGQPVSLRVGS